MLEEQHHPKTLRPEAVARAPEVADGAPDAPFIVVERPALHHLERIRTGDAPVEWSAERHLAWLPLHTRKHARDARLIRARSLLPSSPLSRARRRPPRVTSPCLWIVLHGRQPNDRHHPRDCGETPSRAWYLGLLTGVVPLRRLDSWPDLTVFTGVSLARAAALLWRRDRPTVSVGRKWTGLAVETDEVQSGESVQKTRQVPLVGRTLCWADAC